MQQYRLMNNSNQLNMFREIILPIFRSTRLCVTACGIMHPRCCRPPAGNIVGALYEYIVPHHISYRIISYHIISYHIISYHIISYHSHKRSGRNEKRKKVKYLTNERTIKTKHQQTDSPSPGLLRAKNATCRAGRPNNVTMRFIESQSVISTAVCRLRAFIGNDYKAIFILMYVMCSVIVVIIIIIIITTNNYTVNNTTVYTTTVFLFVIHTATCFDICVIIRDFYICALLRYMNY